MSIVKMKKLRLIALRSARDELMQALMRFGQVELTEAEETLADEENEKLLRSETGSLVQARTDQATIQKALELLNLYVPAKSPLLARRKTVSADTALDAAALESDLLLAERIVALDERIRKCDMELGQIRSTIESLRPWEALDYELERIGSKTVSSVLGTVRAETDPAALQSAASSVSEDVQIFRVSSDADQHRFFVLCMKSERDALVAAMHEVGFEPVSFPGLTGTAKANIAAQQKQLHTVQSRREALTAELEKCARVRDELKLGADRMELTVRRAEAVELLQGTDSVVLMEGWFPSESEAELAKLLSRFDCAWETREPTEEEYPAVPVQLKNNRITDGLNMVTNMYSLPQYGTVDPNPLMAPFFILFYGIMMADMGYGLLMVVAALFALRRLRPKEGTLSFCRLLLWGGIATFVMGIVTGSLFGDAPKQIVHLLNPESVWAGIPALIDPLNDSIFVLAGAMVLGVIHLNTGLAVSFVQKIRRGEIVDAVLYEGALWVILIGLLLFIDSAALGLTVLGLPGKIILILGAAMILAGAVRGKKGFGIITAVFSTLYNELTGWFGDILSYSRIMALMLAGSVIGQVFNTIGAMFGNIFLFIPIFLIGHTLNFGLNLLGCYVHDLRLQCLEYFGKFYVDGGRPFVPLKMRTKYVDVSEANN